MRHSSTTDSTGSAESSSDTGPRGSRDRERVLLRFHEVVSGHMADEGLQSLEHYLGLFPGHDRLIRDEFQELVAAASQAGGESSFRLMSLRGESTESPFGDLKGRSLGRYVLEKQLGRGGQGFVWLARDVELGRLVALKILTQSHLLPERARLRFRREAELASKLDHPHLCAVYEVGEHEGLSYIAMRYIPGDSLDLCIRRSRASYGTTDVCVIAESGDSSTVSGSGSEVGSSRSSSGGRRSASLRIASFFEQVARGLHHAHETGLVHRDVKPANVMVTSDGAPVILDFGLSRDTSDLTPDLTQSGDFLGTPAYMSPEQLEGRHDQIDRRSDVYSLGVSLYETLTLRRPFEAANREALFQAITNKDPIDCRRLESSIPRDLSVVVATAMEKSPERRYQTAAELADELRRVVNNEPIVARPTGSMLRTWRWAQRNPVVAFALTSVFVVLVAIVGVIVWKNQQLESALDERAAALKRVTEEKAHVLREQAYVSRLADVRRLQRLLDQLPRLTVAQSEEIEAFQSWMASARELVGHADAHREALASLEKKIEDQERGVAEELLWHRDVLRGLTNDLARFTGDDGAMTQVRKRLRTAQDMRPRTLVDHAEAWAKASERIQDHESYGGLVLAPQLGLIPLGPDPKSGLEEFLHWESHPRGLPLPARGSDGVLRAAVDTGIVLVLIPGGEITIGANRPATPGEKGPFIDPGVADDESPALQVELDPFFISKYEMTQAQWELATGKNSAFITPDTRYAEATTSLRSPVESMSWNVAREVLRRLALQLPTEAQWECAARGGTNSVWWHGDNVVELGETSNVYDRFSWQEIPKASTPPPNDDGAFVHSPVGSYRANPYGIYDVHGNVAEWCRDQWEYGMNASQRAGDGLRIVPPGSLSRAIRGGSWDSLPQGARVAYRTHRAPDYAYDTIGVRPSRSITR